MFYVNGKWGTYNRGNPLLFQSKLLLEKYKGFLYPIKHQNIEYPLQKQETTLNTQKGK